MVDLFLVALLKRHGSDSILMLAAGHPGRRIGSMIEGRSLHTANPVLRQSIILTSCTALSLAAIGACIGVAWLSLGIFLSWKIVPHSHEGAMAIRGIFAAIAVFVHGYIRISTPRLFLLVLLMIFPTLIGLVGVPSDYVLMPLADVLDWTACATDWCISCEILVPHIDGQWSVTFGQLGSAA